MARSKKSENPEPLVNSFQYGSESRVNIPESTETQAGLSKGKKREYSYNPHLSPQFRFDETGTWDRVRDVIDKSIAGKKLSADEIVLLKSVAELGAQPWLEWAGKQENHAKGNFGVDDVVLHIHERISAQALIATALRSDEPEQDLFARPKLHREQALQYYRHSMDWANRLVLGDSLQVMSSLSRREGLGGKVQTIFMDPPYGIKFSSNWQNEVGRRDVKEKDEDVSREPEMIRAYRDTWSLGVHSYLTYLKQRFVVARELLAPKGSIFVQISDENLHRVRVLMDEVFGPENFVAIIPFRKTGGLVSKRLAAIVDYIIWYARDIRQVKYHQLFKIKTPGEAGATQYRYTFKAGEIFPAADGELANLCTHGDFTSQGNAPSEYSFRGKKFVGGWKTTNPEGMERLRKASRITAMGNSLRYIRFLTDFPNYPITGLWDDTGVSGFLEQKLYVVQTLTDVIERCVLMSSDPGDLVLDPTCGSGTTAFVAERWGRRWITVDSSRVAVAIARQRLLTSCFDAFKTKDPSSGIDPSAPQNPAYGLVYRSVSHVTLKSIAQSKALDPIFAKYEPQLKLLLEAMNRELQSALKDKTLTKKLVAKLRAKIIESGVRSVSEAELRRWLLPTTDMSLIDFGTASQRKKWKESVPSEPSWREWEVPFDTDPDWPLALQEATSGYRAAWDAKMAEVNRTVELNAEQEELVDQPDVIRGVSRVSGPFTVEGVRPEELALGEDGKVYDPTANDGDDIGSANADSYIDLMIGLLRKDGVTFLGNRRAEFESLSKEAGRGFHARGRWKTKGDDLDNVAVFFGPQYGPVNAPMMREAIEGAQWLKEIDELVIAGFSFDSAAQEVAKEKDSESLRIHLAHIRPDVSPGMRGLLKETANSQLFTVFGQPDISVVSSTAGMKQVKMSGVCVYNPLTGEITEASASKVAAWFLDTDYDGRCFCISQAFFPDKEAWSKIAKTLGSAVSEGAFEDATISWPFKVGKHKRIAVKVIDPRGNEVMAIKTLNA